MKLISFAIPCYNSQNYMSKCIESLLPGGDEVEIIIVDDGSTDGTAGIADDYAAKYPDIIKVIHKENGGHGSGVNAGLAAATGIYYKVVDSDDWLDADAYGKLLSEVRAHVEAGTAPDMYVTNFVFSRVHDGKYFVQHYRGYIKPGEITNFSQMKSFNVWLVFYMHALMYRREVLLESGLVLPEHTFYVDEIYAYVPLPYVKTMCYLDIDLYMYFIGRSDQSVTKKNMFSRYEQQIRVIHAMTDSYTYDEIMSQEKKLRKYMFHALAIIMVCTMYFTLGVYDKEHKKAYREMWAHIKERDEKLYKKLRYRSYPAVLSLLPPRIRSFFMDKGYDMLCRKHYLGEEGQDKKAAKKQIKEEKNIIS